MAEKTAQKSAKIKELLSRGVDSVYPSAGALAKALGGRKKLSVYLGIDPTGADIHLGHTVQLRKLRQFQDLGHQVTLLIGDFTGQTGDPTDKAAARQPLTKRAVLANAKAYKKQASAILRFSGPNPVRLRYNSQWLEKLSFGDVAELAGHFTVQQMIERDMFADRVKAGKPVTLREFLYPLMQGYDSVAMQVDVEVGGTDQTFNMLAGRKLAKEYLGREKFVLTTPLLADGTGTKIGKSEGNAIAIAGKPEDLYGQVMALPDEVIVKALEWCTSLKQAEVQEVARLAKRNPRDAKMKLAFSVVAEYQGAAAARKGQANFTKVFQRKERPAKVARWKAPKAALPLWYVLKLSGLAASSSEAHRLIKQGAVRVDDTVIADPHLSVKGSDSPLVQVGKKKFLTVVR